MTASDEYHDHLLMGTVLATILAQLADKNRHRRGGGGGAASGVPASQQLRAMERALVAAGNEECKDDLQRSALTRAAMN
eukprot:34735-Eustigmatos_ZCMA.PRE.1